MLRRLGRELTYAKTTSLSKEDTAKHLFGMICRAGLMLSSVASSTSRLRVGGARRDYTGCPDRLSIEFVDRLADRLANLSRSVLNRARSLVENAFSR